MAGFSAIPGAVLRPLRCGRKSPGLAYRASPPLEAVRVRLPAPLSASLPRMNCTICGTHPESILRTQSVLFGARSRITRRYGGFTDGMNVAHAAGFIQFRGLS